MFLYWLFAYFLGNMMTGFLVVRLIGKDDIRKQGSGNVGARNAGRILGKKGFILTFLGDALKGALIVLIARYFGFADEILLVGIALAILGHIKPILLGFQGGKGISTFIGAMITFEPLLIPIIIAGFLVIYLFIKSFTFAGLGSFVLIPIALYYLHYSNTSCFITIGILIILYFAHRENIKERLSKHERKS